MACCAVQNRACAVQRINLVSAVAFIILGAAVCVTDAYLTVDIRAIYKSVLTMI